MLPEARAILCLCHDRTTLQVRKLVLEHFGYKVLTADSVQLAKHMAKQSCPDLMLLDNNYPSTDCESIAKEMKQACPTMLAAVLSPYFANRRSAQGWIDRFISDDEAPDALIGHIRDMFESRSQEPAASLQEPQP